MSEMELTELDYLERVDHYREHVHDDLAETYDYLLGKGCAPAHAAAALRYLEQYLGLGEEITQEDVAKEYGTTPLTIRNWSPTAWEHHTGSEWPPSWP